MVYLNRIFEENTYDSWRNEVFNLTDRNLSYIIISPEKKDNPSNINNLNCEKLCTILWSKDYTLIPVTGLYEGRYEKSFIAFISCESNDELRKDALFLIDQFEQNSVIVKYKGDIFATKINEDGSEKPLSYILYDSNEQNKTYLYNGISFYFVEQ